jgi:hypothetical protein
MTGCHLYLHSSDTRQSVLYHNFITLSFEECSRVTLCLTIAILDIIHRPVFCLKRDFSETEFCLRLQVESTQLGLIDKASPCLHTHWAELSRFRLKTETESSIRKRRVLNRRQDDG